MIKNDIDRNKRRAIIQFSYSAFREKEKNKETRDTTINKIVSFIKKELKEDAN